MYDKLVVKVNKIGISGFVLKTNYDTDKTFRKKNSWLVNLLKNRL